MMNAGPIQLDRLAASIEGARVSGDGAVEVSRLSMDSREVLPGDLFACVRGERFDGMQFVASALANGAVALAVDAEGDARFSDTAGRNAPGAPGAGVPRLVVPDVRQALGTIASILTARPSSMMRVVGVTGTNGKSTVVHLLESIYRSARRSNGTIGTIGIRINGEESPAAFTTPEAPALQTCFGDMAAAGVTDVAMEVSSHALIQGRVRGTDFAAVGFTNLSHDHLDFHGDLDSYFEAKSLLFTEGYSDRAVIFWDTPWGHKLLERIAVAEREMDVVLVGEDDAADLRITDVLLNPTSTSFTLTERISRRSGSADFASAYSSEPRYLTMMLLGRFNVENAAVAIGLARAVGIDWDAIYSGISGAPRVPGRMEPVELDEPFTVVVDFAHTPDALTHVLQAAQELTPMGRVICVFGCGGDRDRAKRPLMGSAAARNADVVIVTSDNPRTEDPDAIIAEIMTSADLADRSDVVVESDRRSAIANALSQARAGDMVVVAGKGHETGQIIGTEVFAFDDRLVVAEVAEELRP